MTERVDTSALRILLLRDGPWQMVNMQSCSRMIHFVPLIEWDRDPLVTVLKNVTHQCGKIPVN